MRYQIGENIPVVIFKVKLKNGVIAWMSWFIPWEDEVLDISIINLVVTEHHKVPSGHGPDDKLDFDGYILKDEQGRVWHNQYPKAFYGQVSDEGNRTFTPAWDVNNVEFEKINNMKLLTEYLANVQKGIRDFTKMENREKEKDSLQKHFDEVNSKFHELTGKKIVVIPLVFKTTSSNEREYFEDILAGYIEGEIPEDRCLEGAVNLTEKRKNE